MAFILGGGFGSVGGLFGGGNATTSRPIVGIGANLLSANYSAQLTNRTLGSLSNTDRAAFDLSGVSENVTAPWDTDNINEQEDGPLSLERRVKEIRELSSFIDKDDSAFAEVQDDPDRLATFAIYRALTNLQTLAEYAAEDSTVTSSLERLDDQFQQGMTEIREFLAEGSTEKLDLFLGDKEYKAETTTRTGKNNTEATFSSIVSSADDVIEGLTGTEVFSVSITKSGSTEEISIDLSNMTEELTLNNVVAYMNSVMDAELILDEHGDPELDGEGETQPQYITRFNVEQDSNGKYGIKLEGALTEEVAFSAAATEKALYVSSNATQLDEDLAITSRLVEFTNIATTLTRDDVTSFAATDIEASEIKSLTKEEDEEDELDPEIQKLRDQFRSDALSDVTDTDDDDDEEEEDEDASSITNINSDTRVNANTQSQGVVVDSLGNTYVVGHSEGSFGFQLNTAETNDVFLSKFDSEGNLQFSRLLGVSGNAEAYGITVDNEDNVIITGQTDSAVVVQTEDNTNAGIINGDTIEDSLDTFVAKFSSAGTEVFRYQLDTTAETKGLALTVDSNNDIYVAGQSASAFSGTNSFGGSTDGMVIKLDGTDGSVQSSTLIGDSSGEKISAITIANDGDILVAVEDDGIASLKKLDANDLTSEQFSIELGAIGTTGEITDIAVDGTQIVLSGYSTGASIDSSGTATVNGSFSGNRDGFVASFTDSGASVTADFVTLIGTSENDQINGVAIDNGKIYVAGSTGGNLNGETKTGNVDAFVARLDASSGIVEDTELFGEGLASMNATDIGFTDLGNSVLGTLGLPQGSAKFDQQLDLETQTSLRAGDNFYISIDGESKIKIEIEAGDTYDDIARQMRIAGFGKFTVEVSTTSEGDKLKIQTLDPKGSPTLDFLAGDEGRDALRKMGLEEGRILSKNEVFNISGDGDDEVEPDGPDDLGGAFGLALEGALNIRDKTTAKYVLGLLETALGTIQRAERSLTYNPLKALIRDGGLNQEPAPARITAQIANYQTALARLSSSSQSGPASLFI
ncbi:SBBP repeat-containing protein [Temperatibacter marinus]|uniref:SBBP repeat-containing protein n=1 Tax=Temperatibacter marinus TaxID=1456591 RepID=A0AA52EED2_9PROT|nr:SBBP repeat-containing protein [Temperatibacter marinus]WND03241.1 SBBP repeat-containing protein [Temperatibacter marinus]